MTALSRRVFAISAASAAAGLGVAATAQSSVADEPSPQAAASLGLSNSNAAIHQEVVFVASPGRVYRTLTDARLFDKVVLLSGAVQEMSLAGAPAVISAVPGGAFSLFAGYITGRQIELSPGVRIVQTWRSAAWAPHVYSIARFELVDDPRGAKVVFDHTGFPNSDALGLASGWRKHYWEPMAKVLA